MKLSRDERQVLVDAYKLQCKIVSEITTLAEMSLTMAYGAIRFGETLADMIAVAKIDLERRKATATQVKES